MRPHPAPIGVLLASMLVSACSPGPRPPPLPTPSTPAPTPPPLPSLPPPAAVREEPLEAPESDRPTRPRERRALELLRRDELAAAHDQWKILQAVEPENPAYQRQLTATRALIRGRLHLQLEAGKVALEAGDAAGARVHFLRALALSPTNATAVARLRDLEERRAVVVQAAKLRRLAERRARRARSEAAASTEALGAAGQERYYLETGISLFQEGDYDAAIIEIGKYRSSYPDDEQALWYWVEARRRRDGERVESPEAGPPPSKRPVHTPIDGNETEDRRSAAEATAVSGGGASDGASASPPATTAEAEPRNREAAQELYERGLRAYRTDMTEAIQLWEEALSRDPGHVQARLRLERAYKMRQNLERME